MSVISLVAGGPYLALASDSSHRGNPCPAEWVRKLHPLSDRLPLAAALIGYAGNTSQGYRLTLSAAVDLCRRAFDGEEPAAPEWTLDPASYTVAAGAERLAERLHERFGQALRASLPGACFAGFVAGYEPSSPHPVAVQLTVLQSGETTLTPTISGGVAGSLVLPPELPGSAERVRRPTSLADAADLAASLVQLRIEEHERNPGAGRDALGPIHTLTLTPGTPHAKGARREHEHLRGGRAA